MNTYFRTLLVVPFLIFVTSCGGGGGGMGGDSGASMNNKPVINNSSLSISVIENQTSAFTISASDADGDSIVYAISGTDSALFNVSTSGVVTFKAAPDYENPSDGNIDNAYSLTASASDGSLSDSKNFIVTVTNDTSDDEVASAWDGTLVKDTTYAPYDLSLIHI